MEPSTNLKSFLEALFFVSDDNAELEGYTIFDICENEENRGTLEKISRFLESFEEYLVCEHPDLHSAAMDSNRSFGSEVYFSLSGHGVGYWDWSGKEGEQIQEALERFAKTKYLFEQIYLFAQDGKVWIEGLL